MIGKNYDLLFFISTIDYYKAYFIQICTNKNRNLIYIIKNDLMKNEQQNKDIFAKFIDTYISEIKLDEKNKCEVIGSTGRVCILF